MMIILKITGLKQDMNELALREWKERKVRDHSLTNKTRRWSREKLWWEEPPHAARSFSSSPSFFLPYFSQAPCLSPCLPDQGNRSHTKARDDLPLVYNPASAKLYTILLFLVASMHQTKWLFHIKIISLVFTLPLRTSSPSCHPWSLHVTGHVISHDAGRSMGLGRECSFVLDLSQPRDWMTLSWTVFKWTLSSQLYGKKWMDARRSGTS